MDFKSKLLLLLVLLQAVSWSNSFCELRQNVAIRKCRKPCNSDDDCKGRKMCHCDGKCGMSCFNKQSECEEPEEIENGVVRRNFVRWGGTALYFCRDGYILMGRKKRRCQSDRNWLGEKPKCVETSGCRNPERLANGYPLSHKSAYIIGESIEYSCRTGHYMTGNKTRTCTASGWSAAHFGCTLKNCMRPSSIAHGRISFTRETRFGSRATVSCEKGYEPRELGTYMTCYSGQATSRVGSWEGRLTKCMIKTCAAPEALRNGVIIGGRFSREYGDVVGYECNRGFVLKGPNRGVCNENGTWGNIPFCEVDPNCNFNQYSEPTCAYDVSPINTWERIRTDDPNGGKGYVLYTRSIMEAKIISPIIPADWANQYICIKFNYKLETSTSRLKIESALNNRETQPWWVTQPNERSRVWLDSFINRKMTGPIQYQFVHGAGVIYLDNVNVQKEKCVEHCFSNPCQNSGTCVDRAEGYSCFCTEGFIGEVCNIDQRCPTPPDIRNGRILDIDRRLPDTTIEIRCDENFKLVGFNRIVTSVPATCEWFSNLRYSSWSRELHRNLCTEITCQVPRPHVNGRINPDYKAKWVVNDRVTFDCNEGYEIRFSQYGSIARCLKTGKWSRARPQCAKVQCPRINVNNMIEENHPNEYQDTVTIRCKQGYELNGEQRLTCLANKRWNHDQPLCERRPCPQIRNVENAKPFHRAQYRYLDTMEVVCNEGYKIIGESELTCQNDGTWSRTPRCQKIRCQTPQPLTNGRREPEYEVEWTVNDTVIFRCNEGYEIRHEFTSTSDSFVQSQCLKTGEWSRDMPQCSKVKCPTIRVTNMIEEKHRNEYGDSVDIRCKRGYRLLGEERLTCFANKSWDYDKPFCEQITCGQPELPDNINITESDVRDQYFVDNEVSLVCAHGGQKPSQTSLTCLQTGEWADLDLSCIDIACQKLMPNEHLNIEPKVNDTSAPGTVLRFSCDAEFLLEGEDQITCGDDGEWTSEIPQCKRPSCTFEGHGLDHLITTESGPWYPGDRIRLNCPDGFRLIGRNNLQCASNLNWEGEIPACEEIFCAIPVIDHMVDRMERQSRRGETYSFEGCFGGYELLGPRVITCQSNGSWSKLPKCGKKCGNINPPRNASEVGSGNKRSWSIGDVRTYRCEGTLKFHGTDRVTCLENGSWSSPFPVCREIFCDLPKINLMHDNVAGQRRKPGEIYSFQGCQSGNYLVGPRSITCHQDRTWSELPKCQKLITCPNIDPPLHWQEKYPSRRKTSWVRGDIRRYQCSRLFRFEGTDQVKCLGNGSWTQPYPVCKERSPTVYSKHDGIEYLIYGESGDKANYEEAKRLCASIRANVAVIYSDAVREAITNEMFRVKYRDDTYIGYVRNEENNWGFDTSKIVTRLPQSDSDYNYWKYRYPYDSSWYRDLRCAALVWGYKYINSDWVRQYPWKNFLCSEKKSFMCQRALPTACDKNPCLNGGTCNVDPDNREMYHCVCSHGYEGNDCEQEIVCDPPNLPDQMDISDMHKRNRYSVGIIISLVCLNGKLPSPNSLTCLENGWSETELICRATQCLLSEYTLPDPEMIVQEYSWSILQGMTFNNGESVIVTCSNSKILQRGREQRRDLTITCQIGGEWSHIGNYSCKLGCSNLPVLQDGTYARDQAGSYPIGHRMTITCNEGFTSGNPHAICRRNKTWQVIDPCRAITCGQPEPTDLPDRMDIADEDKREHRFGTVVSLVCLDNNKSPHPDASLICLATGRWSHTNPVCKANHCLLSQYTLPVEEMMIQEHSWGDLQRKKFTIGESVTVTCSNSKFLQLGRKQRRHSKITCQIGGEWSDIENYSCKLGCSNLPVLRDGTYSRDQAGSYPIDDRMPITCNEGFTSGNPHAICRRDKTWQIIDPCREITCTQPESADLPDRMDITNEHKRGQYRLGSVVSLVCLDENNSPYPDARLTCGHSGRWSHTNPICQERGCTRPPKPPNGRYGNNVDEAFPLGSELTIICDEGYSRDNPHAVCRENGRWEPINPCREIPVCHVQTHALSEGMIAYHESHAELEPESHFQQGSRLILACAEGHIPVFANNNSNLNEVVCNNGEWDPRLNDIICVKTCLRPRDPPNSTLRIADDEFLPGLQLNFACIHLYEYVGTDVITCQRDGTWSENKGCRLPPGCFLDEASFNDGVTLDSADLDKTLQFSVQTNVNFRCKNPEDTMLSESRATCRGENVWQPDYTEFYCVSISPEKSCQGLCDQWSSDNSCLCHESCITEENCCEDFDEICRK